MQQRVYHGTVSPDQLADYLVQLYDPQKNMQAQRIGEGDSLIVQIAMSDVPENKRGALTVAIVRAMDAESGVMITMGEQPWLTPQNMAYGAMMAAISVLVTPWALFGLIWPVSQILETRMLPNDVWNTIETFMIGQGARRSQTQEIQHPHAS